MPERRRRLIEVAFPLEEISRHAANEKNVKQGHISMLHTWWARRPLAACRAFIYASLVDDPESDQERDELLREVADLASGEAVRNPEHVVRLKSQGGSGLTGAELLQRARRRILDCNGGVPPRLLDPFAGGGAIPLEALRLGCEVEASDLNPVAVLILKGTVEYPQRFGQPDSRPVPGYILEAARDRRGDQKSFVDGDPSTPLRAGLVEAYRKNPLATDVRYWGNWILERAWEDLAEFYPLDPDGGVPVAYLWSRTVACPSCAAEMPLIRQYWLARGGRKTVALKPVLDHANRRVDFEVVEGVNVAGDPAEATTSRGDSVCLLCRQVVSGEFVRQAGRDGRMGAALTAVVLESPSGLGKAYREDRLFDVEVYRAAEGRLRQLEISHRGDLSWVPDEPIAPEMLGLRVDAFGLDSWNKLFNQRQLLTLAVLARLVREAHAEMVRCGSEPEYAVAVATYLAFCVDRFANTNSTLSRLMSAGGRGIVGTFARQALSMVWDYAEANPFGSSASWSSAIDGVLSMFGAAVDPKRFPRSASCVFQADARTVQPSQLPTTILTDPPYYNAIDYAGLSDFFYVWLKRSIGFLYPDLLVLPLTPKKEQAIMPSEAAEPKARTHYVSSIGQSLGRCADLLGDGEGAGVVFAHSDVDGWSTLIEGLIAAHLVPIASWPIDTELANKVSAESRANLKTSVWMACRRREAVIDEAFIGDVVQEMRAAVRDRLLAFWRTGIRGADFFISAIGPALSVYGRHSRVLRPDGSKVTVREFLDLVRREATQVALEQVLHGADLGIIDPVTRQYVTWVWGYSRAPLDAGEAIALCLATGADYGQVVRPGSIAVEAREKSKKVVKLRTIRERGRDDGGLGVDTPARPAPLIDQLQRAANLWSANRMEELAVYRAELGETRWAALRTLGQAVAECLPDGDEDRRLIFGLLGSNVMANGRRATTSAELGPVAERLPGM